MCALDGGLWPFFWITVVICGTVLIKSRRK